MHTSPAKEKAVTRIVEEMTPGLKSLGAVPKPSAVGVLSNATE